MSDYNLKDDHRRARLNKILLARELTVAGVAKAIGVAPNDLCPALKWRDKSFRAYRYRLRIERYLGELVWTDTGEFAEVKEIGKRLKIDVLKAPTSHIQNVAITKGIVMDKHPGSPGFPLFRALILHLFPDSKTLTLEHHHVRQKS